MKKVSVYVAAHDPKSKLKQGTPACYKLLQVGCALKEQRFGEVQDDVGDNISEKNKNYCELTGVYWIWKNSDADIVGICHYRRFLKINALHCKPEYYLDENTIVDMLNRRDIILPQAFNSKQTNMEFYVNGKANKLNEIQKLREVINDLYPDYLEAYDTFMQAHQDCRCNIMICRKDLFDEYCSWLFKILFELERRIDISEYDSVDARIFGYLSERLLNVYVQKNKLNIQYAPMEIVKDTFRYKVRIFLDNIGVYQVLKKILHK